MFNNDGKTFVSEVSLQSSGSASAQVLYPHIILQSPALLSASQVNRFEPPLHRQVRQQSTDQSRPLTISQDEWDLILSLRMMKNIDVLSPFDQFSDAQDLNAHGVTSNGAVSSFYQTGDQTDETIATRWNRRKNICNFIFQCISVFVSMCTIQHAIIVCIPGRV